MGIQKLWFVLISVHLFSVLSAQEIIEDISQLTREENSTDVVKRDPNFFIGVKGMKNYDPRENPEVYYKRAPMGFMGVRGKKQWQLDDRVLQWLHDGNGTDADKPESNFFIGDKNRENYAALGNSEVYYKRAPMGFMGVRGKKQSLYPDNEYYQQSHEYVPKRDGSLIGQIDYTSNEIPDDSEFPLANELLNEYLQKSESNERDFERITNEVDKRAFYGVRGKKSVQNKRPYDFNFRGKFIGVRGKKDLRYSDPQEIKFLLGGPFPKRKAQMGFFGMRGKKWIDESNPEI